MWADIVSFFTNWLGLSYGDVTIPLPFSNNSIDLLDLICVSILLFILIWIMLFIKRIIDSIISIF